MSVPVSLAASLGVQPGLEAQTAAPRISVVVPVYMSAATLPVLLSRLDGTLSRLDPQYEVICVDDCSRDESWSVLTSLKAQYREHLRIVRLLLNSGQHNAVLCGLSLTRGDIVVTMDDDLQHPPEEVPKLTTAIESGYDLVIGAYTSKRNTSLTSWGGAMIDGLLRRIFNLPDDFQLTSFRAISRAVVENVNEMGGSFPYITAMLLSSASKHKNVLVEHHPRLEGRSNYTISRSLHLAANLIFYYSSYPVQFVALMCMLSVLFFGGSGLVSVYLYLTVGSSVTGWTSIIVIMSLFNSLTLVCLFIFAVYIARFHRQLTRTRSGYRVGQIL